MSIAYVFYDAKHNKKNHNIRLIKFSDFQLVIYLYIGPIGILSHRSGVYCIVLCATYYYEYYNIPFKWRVYVLNFIELQSNIVQSKQRHRNGQNNIFGLKIIGKWLVD